MRAVAAVIFFAVRTTVAAVLVFIYLFVWYLHFVLQVSFLAADC